MQNTFSSIGAMCGKKTEGRGQRAEDRRQKTEGRGQGTFRATPGFLGETMSWRSALGKRSGGECGRARNPLPRGENNAAKKGNSKSEPVGRPAHKFGMAGLLGSRQQREEPDRKLPEVGDVDVAVVVEIEVG